MFRFGVPAASDSFGDGRDRIYGGQTLEKIPFGFDGDRF